jgi:hypothetical protein
LEFKVGDHVYLRVFPRKCVRRFGIKGKLAPHYIDLSPITDKYVPLSYQVELPSKLSGVHNVFHVSQFKRCLKPPTDIVIEDTIPLEPDLTYKPYPTKILDQQDRVTHNKTTRFYKIQWNNVTSRVTLFPNYLHYKLNQASSTMVNPVAEVRNQNSKSGVRI